MVRGLRSVSKAHQLRGCEESLAQGEGEAAREVRRSEVAAMGVRALDICAEVEDEKGS